MGFRSARSKTFVGLIETVLALPFLLLITLNAIDFAYYF
jgi:hypothetical protein